MEKVYEFETKLYKGKPILYLEVKKPNYLNNPSFADMLLQEYKKHIDDSESLAVVINASKITGLFDISLETMRTKIPNFIHINNENKNKIIGLSVVLSNKTIATIINQIKKIFPSKIESKTKITGDIKSSFNYVKERINQ